MYEPGWNNERKQTNKLIWRLGNTPGLHLLCIYISEHLKVWRRWYDGRHTYDQNFFFFISTSKCGERGWKCNANVSRDNSMIPNDSWSPHVILVQYGAFRILTQLKDILRNWFSFHSCTNQFIASHPHSLHVESYWCCWWRWRWAAVAPWQPGGSNSFHMTTAGDGPGLQQKTAASSRLPVWRDRAAAGVVHKARE